MLLPSSKQKEPSTRTFETENKLKLLGFPDEVVNGKHITPQFRR